MSKEEMSTQSQANQYMAPQHMKELCKFDKLLHLLQADLSLFLSCNCNQLKN
jgi:hypothetical protein